MSSAEDRGGLHDARSRFVVDSDSRLTANARSTLHPMTFIAPVSGAIEAGVDDGSFDLEAGISGSLQVAIEDLHGSDRLFDGEMRRALDVQRYPYARAAITSVRTLDADRYELSGELTIRGRSRTLSGEAEVRLEAGQLRATGAITIDIRDFGVKPPSLLVVRVQPEVRLEIDLTARQSER